MGRGGPGRGQGRKPLPEGEKKLTFCARLPADVLDWLASHAEASGVARAGVVEAALRRLMVDDAGPREGDG